MREKPEPGPMEYSNERGDKLQWSILDGSYEADESFPELEKISSLKSHREDTIGKQAQAAPRQTEVAQRVYLSGLLLYALENTNPEVFTNRELIKKIGQEVSEATYICMQMSDVHRRQDVRAIAGDEVSPSEIPVMQAINRMRDTRAISNDERSKLFAIVRTLHIKQQKSEI